MKTKAFLAEAIILILVLDFFYHGIGKIAFWKFFHTWLRRAPLLGPMGDPLAYLIPIWQLALSLALLLPSWKNRALYAIMISAVVYVIWIASCHVLSGRIFSPFQTFERHVSWMQHVVLSLAAAWLAFLALSLRKGKQRISNSPDGNLKFNT